MKRKRKPGFYSISSVANMFSVHQQTIRMYEKQGLLTPKRTDGNTRMFTEDDIEKLEEIVYLTHELGINAAGVDMIFKLKKQITKLQSEINKAFNSTQETLTQQADHSRSIAQASANRLLKLQQKQDSAAAPFDKTPALPPISQQSRNTIELTKPEKKSPSALDGWSIEYED